MNHLDLAEDVARRLQIPKEDARELVLYAVCTMFEGLVVDGQLDIAGFGKVSVRDRSPRRVRHIRTGELLEAGGTSEFRFRAAPRLRRALNDPPDENL